MADSSDDEDVDFVRWKEVYDYTQHKHEAGMYKWDIPDAEIKEGNELMQQMQAKSLAKIMKENNW